jgi:hypothetical protein
MRIALAIVSFILAALCFAYSAFAAHFINSLIGFTEIDFSNSEERFAVSVLATSFVLGLTFVAAAFAVLSCKPRRNE